jgi:NAD(P)-dependent dehydrogenase (short-subunit alcohol dehydrogenase family)
MIETDKTQLAGKVALITGGGTGIGRGIALAFADQAMRVVVCGRRKDRLQKTVNAILESGGKALSVQADVTQPVDVDHLVRTTLDKFDQIDILVNNAGVFSEAKIHDLDVEAWNKIMAVNLKGPFLLTRAVLPSMRDRRSGHIINISSESGLEYYPEDGAYGTSKHALNAFGEYIQRENQEFNIRVNTICPGMVVTEMTENSPGLDHNKCLYPEDIADLALWLVTRRANIKIGAPILIQTMLNPWE